MKTFLKISLVVAVLLGLGIAGISAIVIHFSFDLPQISSLADYHPPMPSIILARDGTVLSELGKEKREVVKLSEIPKIVIDSFLAAEDDKFFEHKGVDYWGMTRAMLANLRAGRVVQGGSTITQQVAKSLLLSSERSFGRKIKDFLLAQKIEQRFTKEEILFLYLNQMYFGGSYYGVKSAFKGYYGKELNEVTVAESAMIAGLLVAPGRYSPYVNPEYARKRQEYVLGRLYSTKKITEEQYKAALAEKIKFRLRGKGTFKAPYFTDWVRQRVIELVGEEKFLAEGFKVQTTLDWELQQAAEKWVLTGAKEVDKRQGFKGPIKHLDDEEKIAKFEFESRRNTLKERSTFFTIGDDYEKNYELDFRIDDLKKLADYKKKLSDKFSKSKVFSPGIMETDSFLTQLTEDESYEALVTAVDDTSKLIYVSVGGVPGIIPFSHYAWAHERKLSEHGQYFAPVSKPSKVAKPGDVVLVQLKKIGVPLWSQLSTDAQKAYGKFPEAAEVKKQKYLLCALDQHPEVQSSLLSINPQNGEIYAFVGGTDFERSKYNRVIQALRQPGSSFKPIIYAAALENGFAPNSIIIDSPEALGGVDQGLNWKPKNYDGKFLGPVTLRTALEHSRNIPAIKVADQVGISKILDFSERIGFGAKLPRELSIALGTFGVSLFDLVTTFAIFPNQGKMIDAKSIVSIVDRNGNRYELDEALKLKKVADAEREKVLKPVSTAEIKKAPETTGIADKSKMNAYQATLGGNQVYDPRLAYVMSHLMKGVMTYGTGAKAHDLSPYIAGKTGTTNNYVDAWFVGFSPQILTGVWIGFDDNNTLGYGETGGGAALPIWKEFMRLALKKYGDIDFVAPPGVVTAVIDKETGMPTRPGAPRAFTEYFVEGTEPGSKAPINANGEKGGANILDEDEYFNRQ